MKMRAKAALAATLLVLGASSPGFAQDTTTTAPAATVEDNNDGFDLGWLGLLGLAGLLGLRRRPAATHTTSTAGAR